jgi:hypothetical protein
MEGVRDGGEETASGPERALSTKLRPSKIAGGEHFVAKYCPYYFSYFPSFAGPDWQISAVC